MAPTWRRVREAARGPVQQQAPCPVGAVLHCLVLKVAWRIQARWRDPRLGRGAAAPRLLRPLGWPHCPWRGSSGRMETGLPERLQRSAARAAISLAPPSPAAPSALSMRLAEREPITHPSERTRFTGARGGAPPRTNEAGAEFEPAPSAARAGPRQWLLGGSFFPPALACPKVRIAKHKTPGSRNRPARTEAAKPGMDGLAVLLLLGALFIGNSRCSEFSRSKQLFRCIDHVPSQ